MINHIREEIKQNLKRSLLNYVSRFSYSGSAQPLDLLIPTERKIRSVVGGLETSMGTTVWEPVAKTLARSNDFEVIEEKILKPSPMPIDLANELAFLISARETPSTWISAVECKRRLKDVCDHIDRTGTEYIKPPAGTGVDILLRKDNAIYAFDTKTVQPNLGSIKSFNKQILEWYAYSICKNPEVNINCMIAYPYNPFADDFWSHSPHSLRVLEPRVDAVVEDEFWNILSGEGNTYQHIREILIELNSEGLGSEISELIDHICTPSAE